MAYLNTFFFLLATISLLSLLTNELSHTFAAPDFEGFDAEEFEYEDEDNEPLHSPASTSFTRSPPAENPPPPAQHSPPDAEKPHRPSSPLDLWDDEEFEGIPSQTPDPTPEPPAAPSDPSPSAEADSVSSLPAFSLKSYAVEIAMVGFLVVFAINFFVGRRQNELIALCWASQFAVKDSVFDKNFSLLGTGDGKDDAPLLLKEGADVFRFYASGRRFCKGLLATMELRSRHDLIARLTDFLFNRRDVITFEVAMNEEAMDHVVLAVARRKMAKAIHKESRDLQRFGTMMTAGPVGRRWVAEDLVVVAESKEVAGDLMTDAVIDQVSLEFELLCVFFIPIVDIAFASYGMLISLAFKF